MIRLHLISKIPSQMHMYLCPVSLCRQNWDPCDLCVSDLKRSSHERHAAQTIYILKCCSNSYYEFQNVFILYYLRFLRCPLVKVETFRFFTYKNATVHCSQHNSHKNAIEKKLTKKYKSQFNPHD